MVSIGSSIGISSRSSSSSSSSSSSITITNNSIGTICHIGRRTSIWKGLMNNWAVMVPYMNVTTKPVIFEKNGLVFGDIVVTNGRK